MMGWACSISGKTNVGNLWKNGLVTSEFLYISNVNLI